MNARNGRHRCMQAHVLRQSTRAQSAPSCRTGYTLFIGARANDRRGLIYIKAIQDLLREYLSYAVGYRP